MSKTVIVFPLPGGSDACLHDQVSLRAQPKKKIEDCGGAKDQAEENNQAFHGKLDPKGPEKSQGQDHRYKWHP